INGYFDVHSTNYLDLKHRTQATWNPFLLEYNKISFALTADGLKDKKDFLPNLREAIACGLHDTTALKALTIIPAQYLKVSDQLGTLEKGKLANFIITNGKVFDKNTVILENWVKGIQYKVAGALDTGLAGVYDLTMDGARLTQLSFSVKDNKLNIKPKDSTYKIAKVKYNTDNKQISFDLKTKTETYYLSGWSDDKTYKGIAINSNGGTLNWNLVYVREDSAKKEPKDSVKLLPVFSNLPYNYAARDTNTFMIRNVTVWTNEKEGIIKNTDILVVRGKIAVIGRVGKEELFFWDVKEGSFPIISGSGKHLTPGIIDEHSHIAVMGGVNEGSQSVTAEVRIEDVINAEDINIYRQLAGGVTTSQLLHGSANAIGGQSAVIKLKWGQLPDGLLFPGVTPRIKFALGENVKQANWGENVTERFPQTRMGVEEVFEDAFTRALEYEKALADFKAGRIKVAPPKSIQLEALLDVIKGKRLVTCHSYNQQEINMLIKVAEKFGFKINIFTHVLEGYKVADKIKAHGAGASSFSDWWGYKMEVNDAIPYNAALLHKAGVITCINSDDAEMGRRLNQEAAKTVKYGGVSEEEALKMITLNPAILMKIDDKVGSIRSGKDADLVLWSGPPLSVYSKPVMTFIEGVAYFDITRHQQAEEQLAKEKQALVEAMNKAIASGKKPEEPKKEKEKIQHCEDMEIYGEEDEQ
ncbi:MAG TPA: amidohydrolase family protein, partial [Bacteroidia bacterium]|nr:amidohydrolase family protein [Bacteroidia bacterium]